MSLKQFPSHGKFSQESDRRHEFKDPEGFAAIPQRLKAEVFDVNRSWKMLRAKKKTVQGDATASSGFKGMNRNDAARFAAAAGVRLSADFSVEQAVANFGVMKLRELYAYLFFLILFTTVTFLNRDFYQGNMVYNTGQNAIINVRFETPERPKNFREISQTEDFWDYLTKGMPQYLLQDGYDSVTLQPSETSDAKKGLLYVLRYNQLIQPIRMRQVRVAVQTGLECEANINIIADFNECSPLYRNNYLDTTSHLGTPFRSANELKTDTFGRSTTQNYAGGGFVVDFPLLMSPEEMVNKVQELKKSRWIDKNTRAVFIDMVTYNPTSLFYLSVRLTFEFLPYGDVRPAYSFRIFKGDVIASQIDQVILFWLDIVAFCLIFLYVFFDIFRVVRVGFKVHYRSPYNWVHLFVYGLAIYVFVKKFEYLGLPAIRALTDVKGDKTPMSTVYDYESVGWYYNEIECLTGYIAFLCWIKLLDYSKYLSRRMAGLVDTIARCAYECSIWFFMLFIIVIAYSQAFYIALGPEINGFDSYSRALGTMMIWIFDVVDYSEVLSADQILASGLFLSFQVVYSMLLVNMFIVILLRSYTDVKNLNKDDPVVAELRKKVHVFLFRILERVILFMGTLSLAQQPHNEDNTDDHEMVMERMKEEARANSMAVEDEEIDEIIVNESSLMDLINRLSNLTADVAHVKHKISNVTNKINFTARLQAGDVGGPDSDPMPGGTVAKANPKANPAPSSSSITNPPNPSAQLDQFVKADNANGDGIGTQGGGQQGGRGKMEGEGGGGARTGGKGVSFAIAGAAFGKLPSRPSTRSSCSVLATPARPARFQNMQGLEMQWLPQDLDALMITGSESHAFFGTETRAKHGHLNTGIHKGEKCSVKGRGGLGWTHEMS